MFDQDTKKQNKLKKDTSSKLLRWIFTFLGVFVVLFMLVATVFTIYALQPVDSQNRSHVVVHIPVGADNKEISKILEKKHLIRSSIVFNAWIKIKSVKGFQAGDFYISPSMNNNQIINQLQGAGGRVAQDHLLIREGEQIDEIATAVASHTKYSKSSFINLMNNQEFLQELAHKYPKLLKSSMKSKNVRYHLEGYLFPAKYDVYQSMSLRELVDKMVAKTNETLKPYYTDIKKLKMTVHQVLTLASLIEREGVNKKDRRMIAGVFLNRLDAHMPLQSDIAVMYALKKHKHRLSLKDIKVDSPYNLYVHKGFGPGPFNNPSLDSISAVLNPLERNRHYLYFVADLKTGKVYFNRKYIQHLNKNNSLGQ